MESVPGAAELALFKIELWLRMVWPRPALPWVEVPVIDLSDDELEVQGAPDKSEPQVSAKRRTSVPAMFKPQKAQRTLSPGPCPVPKCFGTAVFLEPNADFLWHLREYGYAVLQGVLGEDCGRFQDEFWSAMASVVPRLDPSRVETWTFPKGFRGIVTSYGLPHADFAWMVRAHPRMRQAFAHIFGTEDLVVSLDAVIAQAGASTTKLPQWLHKDQHPKHAGLSVQAVYTHYGSGPLEAGTCVVPFSHKTTYPWELAAKGDFIRAPEDFESEANAVKPDVPPDSAIFFNSRLVHASRGPLSTPSLARPARPARPARLGVCVAYAPCSRRSEATRRKKEMAYLQGKCSSHWPCDRFSLKPPMKSFQVLQGAATLPPPPRLEERLRLL